MSGSRELKSQDKESIYNDLDKQDLNGTPALLKIAVNQRTNALKIEINTGYKTVFISIAKFGWC